ncbi:MAG TPA: Gfo/Idh/MocA family oxidoreductase [Sedimentisphaerales bacterium]|jgi:predicted dehydrogenase|nr:Gfo/Idh/MocA family oxidoreductase [Sedimentisphaerales bacterium]HNU29388.1 Gfo/Idh/MocA family oxidoreductase [Sedimentisphaerales bacterium]
MADVTAGSMVRREFLEKLGVLSLGAMAGGGLAVNQGQAKEKPAKKVWEPVSERKVRVGIVGFGVCQFGAQFGFQDHPNVEIVAVSDLIPERRNGLMKACRCEKSYDSLEEMVKDPNIEAIFVATDAPSHARHCMEVLNHGKHVMTAVPAVVGSLEQAQQLVETVQKTGLKYMMAETSCFREDCYAMRQIYHAGGFGRLIFSEGEYYHYSPTPIPSYKDWRVGMPPLWYPTHSTAYYIAVTGKRFTSVSCVGSNAGYPAFQPGANKYGNPFSDEVALFQTSEGGCSRMLMCMGVFGLVNETGRVFGEKGYMNEMNYQGSMKDLPDLARPPLPPSVDPGGHGGSHGLLMNEFVTSILQDRQPMVDVYEALAMTVPGIIAHQSALKGGETLQVPQFDKA